MALNARWLKNHLEGLGLSQRQLAKKLRLDASSITLMLQGKRRLKSEEAALMAKIFGVEVAEVLEAAGVSLENAPTASTVALRGRVGDHLGVEWETAKKAKSVRINDNVPVGSQALRFETAGTRYDGLDGAIVLFRPKAGIDPEAIGRLAIVTVKGGGTFIRVLRRGYGTGRWNLAMINGEIREEDQEIESAFLVSAIRL